MAKLVLKKSLGQHFLKDESICRRIADLITDAEVTQLLEVGPGAGALTRYLLKMPQFDFRAIEVDEEKVAFLLRQFPALESKLLHIDFLKADPPFQGPFAVIGNFPYNISSQILFKILDWKDQVKEVVGMFQKEVALRVAAKEGNKDYGILSVLIQVCFTVVYAFDVHENAFNPPPKVKSGVIKLTSTGNRYDIHNYAKFASFVKKAFSQRRKTLRNSMKGMLEPAQMQDDLWNARAEQFSVPEFVALYKKMMKDE